MVTAASATQPGNTFSLEGLTYKQASDKAFRNLGAWDNNFSDLKVALAKTPIDMQTTASTHIASNNITALKSLLKESYENYGRVLAQKEAAMKVLSSLVVQLQETIAYCTPPRDVSLRLEQVTDLTRHGYNLKSYPNKEVEVATMSNSLSAESERIQTVIQKIEEFITTYPQVLNQAARTIKQTTRNPTYGDRMPGVVIDTLIGAKYFMEGFQAFQQQSQKPQVAATEQTNNTSETTEKTATSTLSSSSNGVENQTQTATKENPA